MDEVDTLRYDVLVIGAGGAGLRAAIEASRQGASTALVSKSLLGKAHTVMAEGGMAAALANADNRDSWQAHFRDTLRGGKFLNNWRMAQIHAQEAPARVRELEDWGAVFDRTAEGKISQRNFGGHLYPRLAHVGDRTGLEMIRTLQDKGIHSGIAAHMECTILRLLGSEERVTGAFGYFRQTGRPVVFLAKAIVMASGGLGRIYRVTSNSWEYSGDGYSLALRIGADLIDMEFVQFHPTGMVYPPSVRGLLVTEGVRGEGGVLRNSLGERFMFRSIPDLFRAETAPDEAEAERWLRGDRGARRPPELLTRDVVARAITREIRAGRASPHGGVFLDIASRRDPATIKRKLPSMYHQFKVLGGVDITREPMEIGPTAHYTMGGILVDAESQMSSVPGLFACGECAAGLHGANRLGGNSLSDLLVFGRRAGLAAASFAQSAPPPDIPPAAHLGQWLEELAGPLGRSHGDNPFALAHALQRTMERLVGLVRTGHELETALVEIAALKQRANGVAAPGDRRYNPGWHQALDLTHLLTCAEAVTRSALDRQESRGAHLRDDFPDTDPAGNGYNTRLQMDSNGRMVLSRRPRELPPPEIEAWLT